MLEILKYPDPRLNEKSGPVIEFGNTLHQLLDDMAKTMYGANGVGLAAPQVGRLMRMFVVDVNQQDGGERKLLEFVNPRLSGGEGKIVYEEGCLSVPGIAEEVQRKNRITVSYQDRFGKEHTLDADGLLAVAIQHENDHLDGVLFVERLSPLKRRLVKRKLQKIAIL